MRVLVFGTSDPAEHPRAGVLAEGLRASGMSVSTCVAHLGLDVDARAAALAKPLRSPRFAFRVLRRWLTLVNKARKLPKPDVLLVGYPGHLDVRLARLLYRRTPIVLDHLAGLHDDVRDCHPRAAGLRDVLLRRLDAAALRTADVILVDTPEHLAALPDQHRHRGVVVAVGAPRVWFDAARDDPEEGAPLKVVSFGRYAPAQGGPTIGTAWQWLARLPVEITMIGHGPDEADTRRAARDNEAVRWRDWVAADELPKVVAEHDVCLGIFGADEMAAEVVPHKVCHAAAAGCAIITADTAAQRRALGEAAVLVPAGDPVAIADAVLHLSRDRAELARRKAAARALAEREFTGATVVAPLVARLGQLAELRGIARLAKSVPVDALAPLSAHDWLRYDLIRRMLPAGVVDVLEVNCGAGALAVRLARRYRYLGIEPDRTSFAVAQHRISALGQGRIRNTDVSGLRADERFDLICAFDVLAKIHDDPAALREWARRLRPGGWLLLSMPAHQDRYGRADMLVGNLRRYHPEALERLLGLSGFTDIEVRMYGLPLGYLIENHRNLVSRRKLARVRRLSAAARAAASGRVFQPSNTTRARLARIGTIPFRRVQRRFPHTGVAMVVRARLAEPPRA